MRVDNRVVIGVGCDMGQENLVERRGHRAKRKLYLVSVVIAVTIGGILISAWIAQGVRLRVATDPSLPPFEYIGGEDGTAIVGFDIAIAERIAENARMRLRVVEMSFYGIFSALEEGRVDMAIAAIPITPQRAAQVDFSVSYYVATQVIVSRANEVPPQRVDDLRDRRVAVRLNSIGELVGNRLAATDNLSLLPFSTNDEVFDALRGELVAAILIEEEIADYYAAANPDEFIVTDVQLEQIRYAIATQQDNTRLMRIINRTIRALRGSDEYTRLLERYVLP